MRITKTIGAVYFVALTLTAGLSQARSCGPEHYFAPHDTDNQNPLKYPHADFLKTRQLAIAGNAADERNLGVYYESGYLVTACKEKAIPWYAKAAAHGDPVAIAWMQRHTEMQGLRKSVECFGDNCLASAMDAVQKTVLQRGADGSYTALVTINGKTVRGIVDTGATFVSMSSRMATELGISFAKGRQLKMMTANGVTTDRAVMLNSVTLGNITLTQVEAVVGDADHPLLVGMSFLGRLTINTAGNGMTLVKP